MRVLTGFVYSVSPSNVLSGFAVYGWLGFVGLLFFWRAYRVCALEGSRRHVSHVAAARAVVDLLAVGNRQGCLHGPLGGGSGLRGGVPAREPNHRGRDRDLGGNRRHGHGASALRPRGLRRTRVRHCDPKESWSVRPHDHQPRVRRRSRLVVGQRASSFFGISAFNRVVDHEVAQRCVRAVSGRRVEVHPGGGDLSREVPARRGHGVVSTTSVSSRTRRRRWSPRSKVSCSSSCTIRVLKRSYRAIRLGRQLPYILYCLGALIVFISLVLGILELRHPARNARSSNRCSWCSSPSRRTSTSCCRRIPQAATGTAAPFPTYAVTPTALGPPTGQYSSLGLRSSESVRRRRGRAGLPICSPRAAPPIRDPDLDLEVSSTTRRPSSSAPTATLLRHDRRRHPGVGRVARQQRLARDTTQPRAPRGRGRFRRHAVCSRPVRSGQVDTRHRIRARRCRTSPTTASPSITTRAASLEPQADRARQRAVRALERLASIHAELHTTPGLGCPARSRHGHERRRRARARARGAAALPRRAAPTSSSSRRPTSPSCSPTSRSTSRPAAGPGSARWRPSPGATRGIALEYDDLGPAVATLREAIA